MNFHVFTGCFLVLALFAVSCDSKDSGDEPAPPFKPQDVTPNSWFFAGHERYVGYVLWPEATVDDSNLTGEGYGYGYYYQHRAGAESFDEMMAMCQVPKAILKAMSTRNLVLTCFKHPFIFNHLAYNDRYQGVMVAMEANCFQELMKRRTGRAELLDLFCELQFGDTILKRGEVSLNKWDYTPVLICLMTAVDCGVYDRA